jgi:hypothetical protein
MTRLFPLACLFAFAAAAPAESGADPAEEAATSYRLETAGSTTAVGPGGQGQLVIAIVPADKIHVHPQAPLKITLQATGLALARTSLGHKDAVDPAAEGPRFEVPFTARETGRQEARAALDFFICSDRWCVRQRRELTFTVEVR